MPTPGPIFTTISDKIKQQTEGPSTEPLLIIGTAVDGPQNIPQRITDITVAERLFGPSTYSNGYKNPITGTADDKDNGATLPRAIAQAISAGATNILAVRATGTYAASPSAFGARLDLKALNPGRIYNEVSLTLVSTGGVLTMQLAQPSIKGQTYTTTYASSLTVAEVIDRINADRRNTTLEIIKDSWATYLSSACTTLSQVATALNVVTLSGGTNGTSAQGEDYETSLAGYATKLVTTDYGTFDTLLNTKTRFSIAVLTGVHLDDQVVVSGETKPNIGGTWSAADEYQTSIANDFVYFLDRVSNRIAPCAGVIGLRPTGYRSQSKIIDWVSNSLLSSSAGRWNAAMKWNKAGYFLYQGFKRTDPVAGVVDMGARLQVVAGPEVVYNDKRLGYYSDNFHVSYAAYLTTVPPEQAPIFKAIPGIAAYGTAIPDNYCIQLLNGVGYSEANDLSGKGAYVVLNRNDSDPTGPLVIYDDVTAADRDDVMRNYQVVHLCNAIHTTLWDDLRSFIGKPTDFSTLAAIEGAVGNIMDGFAMRRAVNGKRGVGYDFKVTMQGADNLLGTVRIFLEIVPAISLRKIYFTVAVRQSS